MEIDSKKVLAINTIDKRVTERKSAAMEKHGCQNTLEELAEKGINVVELVTDAHLGIGAMMSM